MKKTSIVITLTTFAVAACILFAFAAAHRSVADARESARPSASQTGAEVLCSAARETDGAAIAKIPLLTVTGEAEYSAAADGRGVLRQRNGRSPAPRQKRKNAAENLPRKPPKRSRRSAARTNKVALRAAMPANTAHTDITALKRTGSAASKKPAAR